jgi:hypothetical protein
VDGGARAATGVGDVDLVDGGARAATGVDRGAGAQFRYYYLPLPMNSSFLFALRQYIDHTRMIFSFETHLI